MLRCENCGERIDSGTGHKPTKARSFAGYGKCAVVKRKKGKN
jgi:hypothetical protein